MTTEIQLNAGQVPVAGGMEPIRPDDGMTYIMPVPVAHYVPVASPMPATQIVQVISPSYLGEQGYGKKKSFSQMFRQVMATISTIAIGIIAGCIGIAYHNVFLISLGVSGIMIGTILLAPKAVTIHLPKSILERLTFWKKKEESASVQEIAPYYNPDASPDASPKEPSYGTL